jgi:hypothetical protein
MVRKPLGNKPVIQGIYVGTHKYCQVFHLHYSYKPFAFASNNFAHIHIVSSTLLWQVQVVMFPFCK